MLSLCFSWSPQGLTVWVQAQPHAVSRLHVTCENFNDDAGSTFPHTVQLYCVSLCQTSNMWQILRNSTVIFGRLCYSPLAFKPVLQIHWSVSRRTSQNSWQREVDVCTPRALHAGCKIRCVCVCASGMEKQKKRRARPCANEEGEVGVSNPVPAWNCWHLCFFSLHYVTGAVLRWISYKSPMQHIQHATSSLTSLIMDEEIVIQE